MKVNIIAEAGVNHNGKIDLAYKLIDVAYESGADAVKFQTYTSDTMTLNYDGDAFKIRDKNNLWNGEHLYNLYERASTPWEWHEELKKHANLKDNFVATLWDYLDDLFFQTLSSHSF